MMKWLAFAFLCCPIILWAQKEYHVSSPSATVHDMPNSTSTTIAQLKKGDGVKFLKVMESGAWAKVQHNGKVGYIDINAIQEGAYTKKVSQATSKKYHVSVFQSAIYKKPNFSGGKVETLSQNTIVTVVGDASDWGKVKIPGGIGYVFMSHLEEGGPKKETAQAAVKTQTYTTKYQVKVHSKPNKSSGVLETVSKDNTVEVLQVVDGAWAKIRVAKGFAYIEMAGLELQKQSSSSGGGGNYKDIGKVKNPVKIGAYCRDGSSDYKVGPKTCSKGNGVKFWIYKAPR